MNKILDKEIHEYLQKKWNEVKSGSGIDPHNLMGIFATGKVCHGFGQSIDDIDLVCCYVPTFEELCLNTYRYKYEEKYNNVKMTDFRYLYDLLLKQDSTIMECTFSDYYIINKEYQNAFDKYVFTNRETLFRYNYEIRISNAVKRGQEAAHRYFFGEDKDINDLYEACRIRIACELFLNGSSIENCINLKKDYHINYLQQILNKKICPNLDELELSFNELLNRAKDFCSNEKTKDLMKEILFGLYTIGLTKKRDFKKLLTNNEQKAFDIIKNNLVNGYGYISIVQLTESTNISRPVFKNVLQKMKDSKVAKITNKGVKGTYIEIIDSSIL